MRAKRTISSGYFYTYVLYSQKDKKHYVGSTKNLRHRLKEHTSGNVKSTKDRLPITLIYYEACLSNGKAGKRELYLKTSWGKRYLKSRTTLTP